MRALLVALGLGLAALGLFLAGLESVFVDELADGRREADAFQRTLDQYATSTFQRALEDDWRLGATWLETVAKDPLECFMGLFHAQQGEVLVPASPTAGPAVLAPATAALRSRAADANASDDSPWAERRSHLAALDRALTAKDRPGIEREVRFLLQHRARFVLPPEQDFPVVLTMLRWLTERSRPAPALLSVVLLDGLGGETPVDGLQRQVLRARGALSRPDFEWLCEEVVSLSHAGQVPVGEFEARCRETLGAPELTEAPALAALESGTWLWRGPRSWFARSTRDGVVAVQVDVAAKVTGLEEQLRSRGLLEPGDAVVLHLGDEATQVGLVNLTVSAPRFAAAGVRRVGAFVVKTVMVGLTFLLGAGIVVVAVVAQRRKLKFVELKSRFISTVSHELRTPLASLRLMAETLERKLSGTPEAKDYPSRLVAEVDGLSFLVENILSFNRLEKGKWTAHRTRWALSALEPSLRDDAAQYAGAKVELSFRGFDAMVEADQELIRLLLLNLQRNACRYNSRDPVLISFSAEGRSIRVTDNGVGVPAEHWETVFEEFVRPQVSRGRGGAGSGLGLALCRRIAELHGARLRIVESSPAGTVFELSALQLLPGAKRQS